MNLMHIIATEDTPEIVLNPDTGNFKFSGRSLPEDVSNFYAPVLQWFDEYLATPAENTIVDFKMTYFNTATSKIILDILLRLEKLSTEGKNVRIRWHYPKNDEDMADAGIEYSEIVDIPFDHIPY